MSEYRFNLSFNNGSIFPPGFINNSWIVNNVTSSTKNLGSTRGKGSSTRIFNNCLETSDNNEQKCMSIFLAAPVKPPLPTTGILFDISTFDKTFDIYGSGFSPVFAPGDPKTYIALPPPLKTALLAGAARWKQFIEFNPEMVTLIRSLSNQPLSRYLEDWNGIALSNVKFVTFNDDTLATCAANGVFGLNTSINISFTLEVKKTLFDSKGNLTVSQAYFNRIIAHELGHALKFPLYLSLVDGTGEEVLPNIVNGALVDFEANPQAYDKQFYPKTVEAFNNYGGWVFNRHGVPPRPPYKTYIPLTNEGRVAHFRPDTLYYLDNGVLDTNFFMRGFDNEIMNPYTEPGKEYYISQVSINALLDIYTSWKGKKYYNYIYKGGNEVKTVDYLDEDHGDLIQFNKNLK
jgi:hypothetical protein